MKKILLFATALCLSATAMAEAQGAGTVKQTTIRYNVPTCENCTTTTYEETVHPQPAMRTQRTVVQQTVYKTPHAQPAGRPCVENNNLGIANPLFFVKPEQISSESIVSFWKEPKGGFYDPSGEKSGEVRGYDMAERIYFGLVKRLALHLEGGYAFQAPKTDQYKASEGAPVPHNSSYDGTVGLVGHLIDTCIFDAMVGIDGTWGRAVEKFGEVKEGLNYTIISPNATAGFNLGPVTPYVKYSYNFSHGHYKSGWEGEKLLNKNYYRVIPGLYIQPSKYISFDINAEKSSKKQPYGKRSRLQYNVGFDVYPYKNLAIGFEANFKKPFNDPMYSYGAAGHIKFIF